MSLHGKRKEIYKYEAPWTVYAMNWSVRPDKRFRLALGSFVEEYNNKVNQEIPDHSALYLYFVLCKCIITWWRADKRDLATPSYRVFDMDGIHRAQMYSLNLIH